MNCKRRLFEQLEDRRLLAVTPEFLADIRPLDPGSKIGSEWIEFKGEIYFTADDGTTGVELWKSDGTEAGTKLVKDIFPGNTGSFPGVFTHYKDLIYFSAADPTAGDELWRTDGTSAGTQRVVDINPGSEGSRPRSMTVFQTDLFFAADNGVLGSELYRSDGTAAGTERIADILEGQFGSFPGADTGFIEFAGQLYFSAEGSIEGREIGTELYLTDGVTTRLVLDADDGSESSFPTDLVVFKDDLYFVAEVPIPPFGVDFAAYLYRVDGETGYVERFFEDPVDVRSDPVVAGNTLYFSGGGDDTGFELFATDGTRDGTRMLRDIFSGPNDSQPRNLFAFGDQLLFAAGDSFEADSNRVAHQLWVTRGTPASTIKLGDELIDDQTPLVSYRNEAYYMGHADNTGWELYKTDGSPAGTQNVADVNPGQANGFSIPKIVFDDQLLFLADNATNGFEIWTWNGSQAEMAEVHLGAGGFTPDPDSFQFTRFKNDLVFSGSTPFEGSELFIIRGPNTPDVPGDADGNSLVNFADFLILSANFGSENATREQGDFDGNNTVDFSDFLILSANFGKQP